MKNVFPESTTTKKKNIAVKAIGSHQLSSVPIAVNRDCKKVLATWQHLLHAKDNRAAGRCNPGLPGMSRPMSVDNGRWLGCLSLQLNM